MDKTAISNEQNPSKIVASEDAKKIGKMTSGEKERSVTVICVINAAGTYIPSLYIHPRKRMLDTIVQNAPAGTIGHCAQSGWTNKKSFLKQLMHFLNIAKPSFDEKHLIF